MHSFPTRRSSDLFVAQLVAPQACSSWVLISHCLFEEQPQRVGRAGLHHRYQLPALRTELVEFLLHPFAELSAEQFQRQFDHLVTPALAHLSFPFCASPADFGSRPALRSASRSTYSICALSERNSSSDQRCAAARTSALMRSG